MSIPSAVRAAALSRCGAARIRGLSMIELIVFIVVVGIAVVGVLMAISISAQHSADPMVRKQVLAIAEALLEEVELMPFTYCDPDDANVTTARSATVNPADPLQCASTPEGIGPEAGETRYGPTYFDNVSDYNGFSSASAPAGIRDITGSLISGLGGYSATVTVAQATLTGSAGNVNSPAAQRITVTVSGPFNESLTLEGWRTRYAPRSP